MASAVDLQVWRRSVDPDAIERELTSLWAEVAREQPIARAMMSNLVIMREQRNDVDVSVAPEDLPLDDVARRHPARILLLYHEPAAAANCPPIAASVWVTTFGVGAARYGIETIVVESHCAAASLPSIVRRLILGDLPTTIWWADDLSRGGPRQSITSMARQLVYDSRTWRDPVAGFRAAAEMIGNEDAPALADLNWRRLAPLRTAVASMVRSRGSLAAGLLRAHIRHRPGERAVADLLAGWIAARMRWPAEAWAVTIDEERHGDEVLRLTLDDGSGGSVTAEQNSRRVRVHDASATAPILLAVPRESTADAVAAQLASLATDVCLRDAVLAIAAHQR